MYIRLYECLHSSGQGLTTDHPPPVFTMGPVIVLEIHETVYPLYSKVPTDQGNMINTCSESKDIANF